MLNLNDLEKEYLKLEKENFPDDKRIKFIANLGGSDEVAYHYELICEQWREDKRLNLESSFDKHGGDGIEFLLEQLTKTADQNLKISTIYLAAQILSRSKHRNFYAPFCDRLIPQITSFFEEIKRTQGIYNQEHFIITFEPLKESLNFLQ